MRLPCTKGTVCPYRSEDLDGKLALALLDAHLLEIHHQVRYTLDRDVIEELYLEENVQYRSALTKQREEQYCQ